MKQVLKTTLIVISTLLILIAGKYILENVLKYEKVPEGMIVVNKSSIDSLRAYIEIADSLEKLAHSLPDTIIIKDTVYIYVTKTVETIPKPIYDTEEHKLIHYYDSLKIENEIDVSVKFDVNGKILGSLLWEYTPIVREVEKTVIKKVPYPVIKMVEIEVPKNITGNYLSLVGQGNDKMFIFGVDYDMVKVNNIYGIQYRRFGDNNIYGIKAGINLNTIFKKNKNGP